MTLPIIIALISIRAGITPRAAEDQPALVHQAVIDAPMGAVWNAFTIGKEQEAWNVAHAELDLRVGGKWRTHYSKDGKLGDENGIEHTILSFDPQHMISFQISKMPKTFPFKDSFARVWHVLYFDTIGPKQTRVTLRALGYGSDEESRKCREFFDRGNAVTLERLKKYCETK